MPLQVLKLQIILVPSITRMCSSLPRDNTRYLIIEEILIFKENYCTGLIFHLSVSEMLYIRVNSVAFYVGLCS